MIKGSVKKPYLFSTFNNKGIYDCNGKEYSEVEFKELATGFETVITWGENVPDIVQ